MKRALCLLMVLLLVPVCLGEMEYDFMELSGLGKMFDALTDKETVGEIRYYDRANGVNRDFVTRDPDEIARLVGAVAEIEIAGVSDVFMTDWYPLMVFKLTDASEYALSFDWNMLELGGLNYELENDEAFWRAIDEIAQAHLNPWERKETLMSDLYIEGSLGKIYGELVIPAGSDKAPLVILSHGFGGNHTGQADYAAYFNARGLATFNFDFCGGGFGSKSDGTMTEMSVLTEAEDLMAIIDYFKDSELFSDLFLWGASQGGFVSTYVAAMRPGEVRALVIEFPAYVLQDDAKKVQAPDGSFPETYRALGTLIGRVYGEDAVSFDIYDAMPAYRGDVLILHGDKDAIVPLSYSQRAVETFENAKLIVMEGQNHGFWGQPRTQAMEAEAQFILNHVS